MIDQSLITQPMTYGLGDLGQVSLSSDISSWGVGEWAAVIGISYVAISLFFDLRAAGSHVGNKTKKLRRKIAKAAVGNTSKIGTVVTVGALAAAGYVAYEAYSQSQTAATQ
jgi:amino acid transporter